MRAFDESRLGELVLENVNLRCVEPHIYSVLPEGDAGISYDTRFGNLYDRVACNPIYNRAVWGYSTSRFATLVRDTLKSSAKGFVLDLGCGSLAFSAKTYVQYDKRPVVLLDRSLKLLKLAKARISRFCGGVPDNLVFLHGDALDLPFAPCAFQTIISLNLLHVLSDISELLPGVKNILDKHGKIVFTTLVKGNRFADKYLQYWEHAGELKARDINEIQSIFKQLGINIEYDINGNMAFIACS